MRGGDDGGRDESYPATFGLAVLVSVDLVERVLGGVLVEMLLE